jgi:hypothetical protein
MPQAPPLEFWAACLFAAMIGFPAGSMSTDSSNGDQSDVRQRIASFMRTEAQARPKEVAQEDVQILRAGASRLDQLLSQIEEARCKEKREKDVQTLRAAADRLDRLLAGITGKEIMPELKLRLYKENRAQ